MKRNEKSLDSLWTKYKKEKDIRKKVELFDKYQRKAKEYTLQNAKYKEMIEDVTYRMSKTNEIAIAYVNGELPSIYHINYNQVAGDIPYGVSFTLINEDTIKKLVTEGEIELPYKKLDFVKDKMWNKKQLNSSVLQGILQGESMKDIAKRITPIVNNNEKAAIRNARTMVTGAENGGRLDSYERLEKNGVILKKVWIATPDKRTRDWHLELDGQEVDVDGYFVDGNGDTLRFPGDAKAEPRTVYNCRCAMKTHIIGFKNDNKINYLPPRQTDKRHEIAIEEEKYEREKSDNNN